jgi:formylglycine-generating enzyme required for sulfatase activity
MSQRTAYLSLLLAVVALLGVSVILGVVFLESMPSLEEEESGRGVAGPAGPAIEKTTGTETEPGVSGGSRRFGLHRPGAQPSGPTSILDLTVLYGPLGTMEGAVPVSEIQELEPDCRDCGDPFNFDASGAAYNVYPAPGEIVMCMQRPDVDLTLDENVRREKGVNCNEFGREVCLTMRINGITPASSADSPISPYGANNYLVGNNPQQWFTDIPPYPRLSYPGIYPGVDFMFYGDRNRFEYILTLDPGASLSDISISYLGATSVRTDFDNNLVVDFLGGRLYQGPPSIFDIVDGIAYPSAGRHIVTEGKASIKAADPNRDPLRKPRGFDQLGYLGGRGAEGACSMAVDNQGYGYVVGESESAPHRSSSTAPANNARGIFITRFRIVDSEPIYNTFFGGSGQDRAFSIAADRFGNVYICGETTSADLPGSPGRSTGGVTPSWNAFISKLDPTGRNVEFTYVLPGRSDDRAYSLAVDREGNVYAAGETRSPDFPFTAAVWRGRRPAGWDAFVVKLDASGSFLHYAVCLGGSGDDVAFGLGLAPDGTVCVAGTTASPDFPLAGPSARPFAGGWDGFITRLTADGRSAVYSTCFGGVNDDRVLGLGVDLTGGVYFGGETASRDVPVTNAIQRLHAGGDWDAFAGRLTADGRFVYATYFGGTGDDRCFSISPSPSGGAAIVGATSSTNFPVRDAMQGRFGGGAWDGFVALLSPDGLELPFSSYLGGHANDFIYSVMQDARRGIHCAGTTSSTNLPAVNSMQTSFGGGASDAVLAHIPAFFRPEPELRRVPGGGQPGGPEYDFYMGKFEITNEEFARFLNDAQAHTNHIRGTNLWFDAEGNVWFNPAMVKERDEIFSVFSSRVKYNPDFPCGARYFVTPEVPSFGASYSNHPAAGMSWYGAVRYCNWLTIDTGRSPDQRCYREGTNSLDWAPVTCSASNWALGYFSMAERDMWVKLEGFRLPMDNCLGRKSFPNPYNEFLKAAAWSGSTNHLYGFGRSTVNPGDANYLDDEVLKQNDTTPVGFFDGSNRDGLFQTRTNRNTYGIHDLSGSVLEWLSDPGSTNSLSRASYGGCWIFHPSPVTERAYVDPAFNDRFRGFRIVTTQPSHAQQVVRIPYAICLKGCGEGRKPGEEAEKPPARPEPGEAEEEGKEPNVLNAGRPPGGPPGSSYKHPPGPVPPPPPPPWPHPPPPVSNNED